MTVESFVIQRFSHHVSRHVCRWHQHNLDGTKRAKLAHLEYLTLNMAGVPACGRPVAQMEGSRVVGAHFGRSMMKLSRRVQEPVSLGIAGLGFDACVGCKLVADIAQYRPDIQELEGEVRQSHKLGLCRRARNTVLAS